MYLDAVLVVYVSHDVIAWNGMATVGTDKLVDVLVCDDKRFLLVEFLAYREELLQMCSDFALVFLVAISLAEERNVIAPTG